MGYLNKICKFFSRLYTIWKLDQHPTKGKNPLSTSPKDIVHYCYYDNHIFHHSNFTISNSGGIKIRRYPLYGTLLYSLATYPSMYIIHSISYIRFFSCIKRMNEIWKWTFKMKFSNMSQTPNKDFQKGILEILENIFAGQLLYENLLILSTLCLNIDWWLWMEIDAFKILLS